MASYPRFSQGRTRTIHVRGSLERPRRIPGFRPGTRFLVRLGHDKSEAIWSRDREHMGHSLELLLALETFLARDKSCVNRHAPSCGAQFKDAENLRFERRRRLQAHLSAPRMIENCSGARSCGISTVTIIQQGQCPNISRGWPSGRSASWAWADGLPLIYMDILKEEDHQ